MRALAHVGGVPMEKTLLSSGAESALEGPDNFGNGLPVDSTDPLP